RPPAAQRPRARRRAAGAVRRHELQVGTGASCRRRRIDREPVGARAGGRGVAGARAAHAPEPGFVVQGTPSPGRITAASRDLDRDRLAAALAPLGVPGIDVVAIDDEREVLWEKAARLAVLAGATVASGRTVGSLRDDPPWRERMRAGLDESVTAAAADGVSLSADQQWGMIEAMPPELTTSAASDAGGGRRTELDAITGSVVRAAARLGVDAPVLSALHEEAR